MINKLKNKFKEKREYNQGVYDRAVDALKDKQHNKKQMDPIKHQWDNRKYDDSQLRGKMKEIRKSDKKDRPSKVQLLKGKLKDLVGKFRKNK